MFLFSLCFYSVLVPVGAVGRWEGIPVTSPGFPGVLRPSHRPPAAAHIPWSPISAPSVSCSPSPLISWARLVIYSAYKRAAKCLFGASSSRRFLSFQELCFPALCLLSRCSPPSWKHEIFNKSASNMALPHILSEISNKSAEISNVTLSCLCCKR